MSVADQTLDTKVQQGLFNSHNLFKFIRKTRFTKRKHGGQLTIIPYVTSVDIKWKFFTVCSTGTSGDCFQLKHSIKYYFS